jgi:antitoxin HicB
MSADLKYPIVIYPAEEGGYVAEVPALKGCLALGDTLLECLEELKEVQTLWLESAKRHKEKVPSAAQVAAKLRKMVA